MDDDSEQTFRKYEEELEINDFPQQARWRVTSKVRVLLFTFLYYYTEWVMVKWSYVKHEFYIKKKTPQLAKLRATSTGTVIFLSFLKPRPFYRQRI